MDQTRFLSPLRLPFRHGPALSCKGLEGSRALPTAAVCGVEPAEIGIRWTQEHYSLQLIQLLAVAAGRGKRFSGHLKRVGS